MTNKTKTTILLSIVVAMFSVALLPANVFAHTPTYGGTLPNDVAYMYFHSSLNDLNVDGSTGHFADVRNEVQSAMATYNSDPADVWLYTTNSYYNNNYAVYAINLGLFGPSAQATFPNNSEEYVRFNTARHFGTNGGCSSFIGYTYAYNLEWLSNHELGHVVGLGHAHDGDVSVMQPQCTLYWSDIQNQDSVAMGTLY